VRPRGLGRVPGQARLFRRSRWRVAAVGALAVTVLLGLLSAGAYVLARQAIYGRLQERLEAAASQDRDDVGPLFIDEGGHVRSGSLPQAPEGGSAFRIMRDAELGALAVLRQPAGAPGPRVVATPAADSLHALSEFLWILVGLTLAGGLAALPTGYALAGRALQPLEAAVRERSEFVARASHQLRTPLSVIRTSADLALAGRGLPWDEALQTIRAQTERMQSLADRLNDLARVEARPADRRAEVDLAAAVREVAAAMRPAAEPRGVRLEVRAEPSRVRASPDDVTDMLAAVLENAVRFSPPGESVEVALTRDGRWADLAIADRGPGIPPEEVGAVTQPFFQGSRAKGSHGLGLAIARAAAERCGGRLSIDSRLGGGTTVRIRLPHSARS
jgi:signal transduction histidine kinase